jgi:membrane-associated protein
MSEIFRTVIDIFLHLDKNLAMVVSQYGTATYGFLFLIIFMETGFVVTPFLPGDSLIFTAAALCATSSLSPSGGFNIWLIYVLLIIAAILGDTINYWIGHYVGPKIFETENKLIKKKYLIKTQKFYDKYGGQAITLGRFVPIVRTFVPFVAGIGKMSYKYFIVYNIIGGILWVSLFTWTGYFFGNLPFVKTNFHYVVLVIIIISICPMLYEFLKSRKKVPAGH